MTKQDAIEKLANYILENEKENYVDHCRENDLDVKAFENVDHVYALACIALDLEIDDDGFII